MRRNQGNILGGFNMASLKIILYVALSLCLIAMSECHPSKQPSKSKPFKETKSEKELSKFLLSKLDEPKVQKRLITIMGKFEALKKRHQPSTDDNVNQWVFATPLTVIRKSEDEFRITYKFKKEHYYNNYRYNSEERKTMCKETCVNDINNLITRIKTGRTLTEENNNNIHTEIQMLYRDDDGKNLLKNEEYKDKVILVYSEYIPCSQNQKDNGGVFAECAGEMAAFRAMREKNINNNYFIVIHTDVAKDKLTVVEISRLYMELGGIPSFKYDGKTLKRDPWVLDHGYEQFIDEPLAIRFPRPLSDPNHKFTKKQLYVDCLAWNNFLLGAITDNTNFKFESIVTKSFMYDQFSPMDSKGLRSMYNACKKGKDTLGIRHQFIIEACYKYVVAYSNNLKKKDYIVENNVGNYYTANGAQSKSLQKPIIANNWKRRNCPKMVLALNGYFSKAATDICQEEIV